jgi:nucleoside-diphosphate-sugar epimerase
MIVLFGHGYIGEAIARELTAQQLAFSWLHHGDPVVANTSAIINAAGFVGFPNVDACEQHRRDCIRGNIVWPLAVERCARDVPVIHIGTGCIYTGGPFTEDDPPNFTESFYSLCKAEAETALKPYLHKSAILRVRMPFGGKSNPRNLLTKLQAYETLVDARNSVSCIEDVSRVAVAFAKNPEGKAGIWNCVNPGPVLTREIMEMMGLQKKWFLNEAEFLRTVTAPRSHCVLSADKLLGQIALRPAHHAIEQAISRLKAEACEIGNPP